MTKDNAVTLEEAVARAVLAAQNIDPDAVDCTSFRGKLMRETLGACQAKLIIRAIEAAGYRIERAKPPDWDDLRGMAPQSTGDKKSEEFVRDLRDDWE